MVTAADRRLTGLGPDDAARRLVQEGPNELPRPLRRGVARRIATQLRDPLVLVLLAVAAVTISIGDQADTAVVLLVVVGNTAVGVVQEVRADRAVEALDRLGAARARVRRAGAVTTVPAREVVSGDVLVIAAGDVVAADGTVLAATGLELDEAAITGESEPVGREAAGTPVLSGSVVTRGHGELLVDATGPDSAMGRTATLLVATRARRTPLQHQMAQLGRRLAVAAAVACAAVLVIGLLRGAEPLLVLVAALSLAVAAVPESLPIVVTLGLALGARRMAAHHAVVRGLPAVETLGSVTVLALDKTGTLTEGRPSVVEAHAVPGVDLDELARIAALGTEVPVRVDGEVPGLDPTERALVVWAADRGVDVEELRRRRPRRGSAPFDARHRASTSWHEEPDGVGVVALGAPESLLGGRDGDGPWTALRSWVDDAAGRGLRALVLAGAHASVPPADPRAAARELPVLGAVALLDRPRPEAAPALARCRAAGIRPVVLTGDHPATASAVAERVGLTGSRPPRTVGADDAPDLAEVDVIARCRPERKLDLVADWQHRGEVVAMTGDGVNDGPALRRADVGVALGEHGTEVARQAADLVLVDDDLGTLVTAVEEGRHIHVTVRRFLAYALAGGLAEVLVMLLGPAVGVTLPLLPAQILWINLLTHGLPGVAFGTEPADPGAMSRPPRRPGTPVLGEGLWVAIVVLAALTATLTLVATALSPADVRTPAFLTLGVAQLGVAIGLRARRTVGRKGPDWLLLAVLGAVVAQIAAVTLPPLQLLLGTSTPSPGAWALAAAGAVLTGTLARLVGRPRVAAGRRTGTGAPGDPMA